MILAASYGTVGDIEIAFTLISVIGIWFSAYNTREALEDLATVKSRSVGNGRLPLAQGGLQVEMARLVILIIFAAMGVAAMLLPERADELDAPWRYVVAGILFRWGLLTVAVLVMLQSAVNRNVRHYLRSHPPTQEV